MITVFLIRVVLGLLMPLPSTWIRDRYLFTESDRCPFVGCLLDAVRIVEAQPRHVVVHIDTAIIVSLLQPAVEWFSLGVLDVHGVTQFGPSVVFLGEVVLDVCLVEPLSDGFDVVLVRVSCFFCAITVENAVFAHFVNVHV